MPKCSGALRLSTDMTAGYAVSARFEVRCYGGEVVAGGAIPTGRQELVCEVRREREFQACM